MELPRMPASREKNQLVDLGEEGDGVLRGAWWRGRTGLCVG